MNRNTLQQIIKEEYVNIMLERAIGLTPEQMDKLHSDGSVSVGEDTVTYEEPENPTPVDEGKVNEESAMKAIIDAKKGAKASGGGNSNWTKIGRNSWKNKKTGKLSNDTGLYDRIGEFSDFVIEGKLTEISKEEKAAQFKFKLFLKKGLRLSVKDGEDKLYNYAQELDRLADDEYNEVVDPLFMAVELVQDAGEPGKNNVVKDKEYYSYMKSAQKHINTFQKNAKKAIKGMKEGVNEYGGSDFSKITSLQNYLTIDLDKFEKGLKDSKHKAIYKKARKQFMKVVTDVAWEHSKLHEGKVNEEDYKYKKYVSKAFDKISDAMFAFRNAMGVKQLGQANPKLKKRLEAMQVEIFALRREMKSDGLTEGIKGDLSKAYDELANVTKLLLKNLERYKAANTDSDKAKWKKAAGYITSRKKKAEAKLEKLVQQLDKDVELVIEAKLPKRFTVKTKQTIDGTIYSPGDYALKKKRAGGGIYLNMDKGEMLGVDARNIPTLIEGKQESN